MSSPDATIPVYVARKRKNGTVLPFTTMRFTRVPSVGEHIAFAVRAQTSDDDAALYLVTNVVHIPVDVGGGKLAEVWAVEADEQAVGFKET